jgi:hypothetical protein
LGLSSAKSYSKDSKNKNPLSCQRGNLRDFIVFNIIKIPFLALTTLTT